LRNLQKKNNYLLENIKESNELKGIAIDDELHNGLSEIMKEYSAKYRRGTIATAFTICFEMNKLRIQ